MIIFVAGPASICSKRLFLETVCLYYQRVKDCSENR